MITITRKGQEITATYYNDYNQREGQFSTYRDTPCEAKVLAKRMKAAVKEDKGFVYIRNIGEGLI
jgi:hypothetical protein